MRLTKKNEAFLGDYQPLGAYCDVTSKLGELEDVEEELGVDLITLFKALKYGVFDGEEEVLHLDDLVLVYTLKGWVLLDMTNPAYFPLRLYGKTWALTKDELNK